MSELALKLIAENKKTKAAFLDLGNCGLMNYLPDELLDCVWLEELNLGGYFWDKLNTEWIKSKNYGSRNTFTGKNLTILENLSNLHTLYLNANKISDYSFLEKLSGLQSLYLNSNNISDISFLENLNGLQSLDLSYNQISDYSFLEKLSRLQSLDLSYNQISDYSFLEKLSGLQFLYLRYNQISDYDFLENLSALQLLDLSSNQITNIRFLENLVGLQSLNLGSNKISDIRFLKNLVGLQSLNLSSNQILDIRFLENLIELKSLDLSFNQISDIHFLKNLSRLESLDLRSNYYISDYSFLVNLINLQSLYLSSHYISDFSFLENLKSLQSLYLNYRHISDYSFLENLVRLQSLYIHSNYISDFSFLEKLNELQSLHLHGNQISDIRFLENMKCLQSLNLSSNEISDISFLENLIGLQSLDLHSNRISDISFLENLIGLQSLNLRFNEISDASFLENLTALQSLDLRSNEISDISFLKNLTEIQSLDLSENRISDISFLENLTEIQSLNLNDNQISDISFLSHLLQQEFRITIENNYFPKINNKDKIIFNRNPITNPPNEIVKQGRKAIINWFEEKKIQGEEIVYEAKLMIIGDAGSGKTSLSSKIKNIKSLLPNGADFTTVGIDISEFKFDKRENLPEFKVNIWDLGGQKIYHPLHQLFFSRRSLYVLVVNGREENDLEDFWIPVQELLGKDSPMLILFNQHGKIQSSVPFRNLKANYPNIKGDLSIVDLLNNEDKTKDFIYEIEKSLRGLPQFEKGEKLPKLWVRIREAIAKKTENYVELKGFRKLCSDIGIIDLEKQDFVSDYLHDLGIILRFRDDALLNKIVFLKPQWALDAIYRVLDHTREHQNGLFRKEDLLCVWNNQEFYDAQDELLALMKKFELCYEIDSEQYLVPSLLPEDLPNDFEWDKSNNITLHYEYDFMPKGIISRLIVRLHYLIAKDKLLWREGVIFEYQGAAVWLTKFANKRIELYAKGYKPSSLITIITKEIDEINSKYQFSERSKPTKKVPCICDTCNGKVNSTYYSYDDLILRDINGKKTVECTQVPFLEVYVKDLLENVEDNSINSSIMKKNELIKTEPIKIFVTYCWTDKDGKIDEEYQKKVRAFTDELIDYEDFDATFVLYENEKSTATNFIRMMYENINSSKKVIIVLSEGYAQKADIFSGGVGTEYQAIMNDIQVNPRKYILVSFNKRSGEIYPFGLQGTDTLVIKDGNLELAENKENRNSLFAKLKDEALYEKRPKGNKEAVVEKK